jgi:hypothetical protein
MGGIAYAWGAPAASGGQSDRARRMRMQQAAADGVQLTAGRSRSDIVANRKRHAAGSAPASNFQPAFRCRLHRC